MSRGCGIGSRSLSAASPLSQRWGTCQVQKTEGEKVAWQRTAPGALPNSTPLSHSAARQFTSGTESVCKGLLWKPCSEPLQDPCNAWQETLGRNLCGAREPYGSLGEPKKGRFPPMEGFFPPVSRKEGTNKPVDRGSHLQQLTPPSCRAQPGVVRNTSASNAIALH